MVGVKYEIDHVLFVGLVLYAHAILIDLVVWNSESEISSSFFVDSFYKFFSFAYTVYTHVDLVHLDS